ncbi:uncharacterized protein LOC122005372 isoform X1 [Zingiber officinale]|uniref:uncharacterized protein LOC122005372 isoform X1 n=1 Tax=Zingiber officinale TaxID=94328 RepID=UPI001C4BB3A6|nr:uncharacterized protein LOC122005372 isoform X1 [Zingiber officinale]XP_042416331.1 uncharacterized protein LOC122005372 isoform X1 [Zingiber officinale]
MQLWQQQQLLCKKFQEERRQQQLRQLDQEKRQLIPHSQLSVLGKPATGNQLAATSNDMPINDAHNYMWPNNFVGDVSNLPINSQMFIPGSMNLAHSSYPTSLQNLANGSFMLNDHNRGMLSMGFTPQNDQFIHGMPISGTGTVEQYPHFLGISSNFNNLVAGPDATLAVKSSYPFATTNDQQSGGQNCSEDKILFLQNLQGRNTFGNPPMQVLGNDVTAGNFLEASNLQFHDQFRDFQPRQEQDDTSGNLHGKQLSDIGNCRDAAGLDPIEQKLLFGTDEDDNWGSFAGCLTSGIGGEMHGHSLEIDHYGTLPSVHSGSWSALMQEAVQASTSDKGVQEEWSGLSSQNTEPVRTPSCVTNDNGKQPTAWVGNNIKNQASLTAQPFSLLSGPNATTSSSSIIGNKSLLLKSAHEENNMPLIDASHVPSMSSLLRTNGKEFTNSQNQTKPVEGDVKAKLPISSEMRSGQIFEQCQNRSRNTQLKPQDNGSGWTGHKNLHLSNAPTKPVNNLGGRSASHAMASRGDSTSDYHEIHGNHVNRSAGAQAVKSGISSPKMQSGDYLAGDSGSVGNPNPLKLNQNMPQQTTNEQKSVFGRKFAPNARGNFGVDKDARENQNQPNPKLQSWELSRIPGAERLGHIVEKEKDSMEALSGKGYVGDALKDIVVSGGLNTVQHGQHTVGPNMVHNSLANLKNNAEPTSEINHQLNMQGFSNSIFNRSNIDESFRGRSHFAGHAVCNNPMNATEQKIVVEAEDLSKHAISICSSSSFFNGSTAQYAQNETISQASNMLELLHKVDRSRDVNSMNSSDRSAQVADDVSAAQPHVDLSSISRGFGLQLAPPSPQLLSIKSPISHNLLNDPMIAQSSHQGEASYQDQAQSNYASLARPLALLHESSETQNWDKISNPPGHQQNKHMEAHRHLNSSAATAPDFPLVQKQLHEQRLGLQRQDHSGAKYHLEQHQEDQISNTSQANVGTPAKSSSLVNPTHDFTDGAVASQSVETSLPTLNSRFSTSGVASHAENHGSGSSQFFSGRGDHTKPTVAGFSQIKNPGHQLPATDTKSVSHSSASGMSQQDGISKMLHNVWTNISVQQRQAGVNPLLTPNVLQSLINHGRERSSWGMPKTGSQINKEEGAPEAGISSNSQKDENPAQVRSSNLLAETMDVSNAKNMFQGEEVVPMPAFGRGSSFPVSSLVHLHQHNVNKGNHELGPAVNSRDLHSPITTDISSSSVIGILGGLSKSSDHQQQNYSLLHQMQTMKASDSDINKLTGNMLSGAPFGSNTPQMNLNVNQRFDHEQNSNSKYPDVKVGAPQVSLSSDAKMLRFAANDNEEKIPTTSSAGQGILQTHMHPLSTSSMSTALGGTECTQSRPQMSSWVEHNAAYQNGRMVPLYDAQRSGKFSMHQYVQEVPARMEDSTVIDQRCESTQAGGYEQGILSTKISPNESSPLLLPNTIDQSTILRHKKRKSVTADLPWYKIVTECSQSLENTSMADLEWNSVAKRLMEKVDDDAETLEDDPLISHSRRRLIMPTQLMHQLVPAVPSALLKEEAALAYESMPFVIAKSVLADACGLVSYIKNGSHEPVENENMMLVDIKTSKVGNGAYSNLAENFIGRSEKLESDFSRLAAGPSLLEMQMECQELERFSIVNRLGKFHGRTHADAVEVSATGAIHPRTFAQRQITAVSMSGNLPEGIMSLPL